jgi:hypothetical protein
VLLLAAGVFALFALGFLLATVAAALATFMPHWLADLAVGLGLLFLVTIPLALIGKGRLRNPPVPKQAIQELKVTQEALKGDGSA